MRVSDLWEDKTKLLDGAHRFVGFDSTYSIPAYRQYLRQVYNNNISALNEQYATAYTDFSQVIMATSYPLDRNDQLGIQKALTHDISLTHSRYHSLTHSPAAPMPESFGMQSGYNDLIQWRKHSIGNFVAQGALAVRSVDSNHIMTYAMLGGIFDSNDANVNCEDPTTIIAVRC